MHTLKVFYKPDGYPDFVQWKEFSQIFDLIGKPSLIDLGGTPIARPGFAVRVSLGKPADACDPNTGRRLRRGYNFQIKIAGTGHVVIDRFRLHAQKLVERSTAKC